MEQDKIRTLSSYADNIERYIRLAYVNVLDDCLTIKDIKSPYTLIGLNCEMGVFTIMRGYKKTSLIKRYINRISKTRISNDFFIINVKSLKLEKYKVRSEDVSTKHFI